MADTHPFSLPSDPFAKPIPEILRYFDAKGLHPTFHWQDLNFDEHASSFTVAKSAGYDILADIQQAVSKAIHDRQEFEEFRKGLEPLLKAKGWWGKAEGVDPQTGEITNVQLGSARRLRTIYAANVRTAYAAGQWERIWRTRRVVPFLLYVMSTAEHKRPLHVSWVGTILPIEHPWWDTHYPPNGWNCQCRVRQISDREAKDRNYDPDEPAPDDGFTPYTNKRTGQVVKVPRGIDPGWAQNPGKTRTKAVADFIAGQLDAGPAEARRVAVADIVEQPLFKQIASGEVRFDPRDLEDQGNVLRGQIALPVAVLPDTVAKAIGAETRVVRLSVADAVQQSVRRLGQEASHTEAAPDFAKVQQLIDGAEVIKKDASTLIAQGELEGGGWVAVLRRALTAVNEVYLKSFRRQKAGEAETNRARGEIVRSGAGAPSQTSDAEATP